MNRITISLIFLIVFSMVLPASSIMYASGQTDNSGSSTGGGSTDNSGSSTGGGSTDNSGSSTGGGSTTTTTDNSGSSTGGGSTTTTTTDNSGSSTGGGTTTTTTTDNSGSPITTSTQNNAALPSGSTVSNNTGNAYCDTCNNDIYNGGVDLKSMVLAVHNRERAAVGVPPLVWNDTLAIGAKTWAEHLATLKVIDQSNAHSSGYVPGYQYGESIATGGHNTTVPVARNMQGWIAEKNNYHGGPITATNAGQISHYTMMVWRTTTSVGCGTASGGPNDYRGSDILVCRYSPGPTHGGGNVFGENPY